MENYNLEQRVFFVKTYYQNGACVAEAIRKIRTEYGRNFRLNESILRRLIKKFDETGTVGCTQEDSEQQEHRTILL